MSRIVFASIPCHFTRKELPSNNNALNERGKNYDTETSICVIIETNVWQDRLSELKTVNTLKFKLF